MRKKIEWQWELLSQDDGFGCVSSWRAKVIGGWIFKSTWWLNKGKEGNGISESMVFIADRDHEWEIVKPFNPSETGKPQTPKVNAADFESPKA